ncbi:MAG: EAL domain-containing protein [Candidatus Aminicenantes bacterium]|nr:MAG: EAL domain-containing protein [Candidatus Aminicenantes bacterium]
MKQAIAIFEDEGITALHLRTLLTGWGYSVVAVEDTAESVAEVLESAIPDLVLMDIRLKGEVDGIDAAKLIHERFGVPVVFLSAHHDASTRRRVEESHAYGLVVKPFADREVKVAVSSALHRRRIERALAPAIDGPAPTLSELGDAVMATDAEGRIVYMNEPAEQLTGWNDIDAFEHEATDVIRLNMAEDGSLIEHPVSSVLQNADIGDSSQDSILTSRSGSQQPISHRVTSVRDRFGELLGAIVTIRRRRELPEDVSAGPEGTRFDALTGLVTFDVLADFLGDAIARARSRQTMVAVFFAEIDRFDKLRESLGPETGNGLLSAVASRLQKSVRASDSVARIRDTTFSIIQPDLEYAGGAVIMGEKLVRSFRDPFVIGNREIAVTASIGAALFPVDGERPVELLRQSEVAGEKAKAAGRDQLHFCSEKVDSAIAEERNLGDDIDGALANKQFEVVFQPVFDLSSKIIMGAEARLQWHHPGRGLIPASVLLPVAERHGKLPLIMDWTLRQALTRGASLQRLKPGIRMSVQLPGSEIRRRSLVPHLLEILGDTAMEPRHLDLELSEEVLVTQPPMSTHLNLQRLSQLGVSLTLDNFGSAYASMMALKKTPVRRIKVDGSLVAAVHYEKEAQAIVKTTIDLARNCGLEFAADGVNNQAQWRWLRYHGCEIGQGEFLSGFLSGQALFERLVDQHL